ncbi:hypothetical protein ACFL4D_03045, partial [Candidatus Margulisiibacteriota bacterium]
MNGNPKFTIVCFLLSLLLAGTMASADEYPQLDIMGYKEYNLTQSGLGGNTDLAKKQSLYKKFPTNISNQAFKWEERLSLYIAGKLSEDLAVSYSLEQEPDFPDRYDIKVKYQRHELNFGHFNADFKGGDFISFSKAMDGFMADSRGDDYKVKVVTAKERSTARKVTIKGNGNKEYSLGQKYILPGSVKVRVDNDHLPANYYSVDNYNGKIIFDRIMTNTNIIEIMYEYTNPIADWIPTLGKVSFTGFQADYSVNMPPDPVAVITANTDIFVIQQEKKIVTAIPSINYQHVIRPDFKFNLSVAGPGEVITINAITPFLIRRVWIEFAPTTSAKIQLKLLRKPSREDIKAKLPLYLTGTYTIPDGTPPGDYQALISFQTRRSIRRLPVIYNVSDILRSPAKEPSTRTSSVPPTESIRQLVSEFETGSKISKQTFMLKHTPLTVGSEQVKLNGVTLVKDFDYYLNYLEGKLKIVAYELSPSDNIEVTYKYHKTMTLTENVNGAGTIGPYFLQHSPIVRKSEQITLDNRKLWRGLDYTINYLTGKLNFTTKIYPVSKLTVHYRAQVMTVPVVKEKDKLPELYTVGISYLEERSKTTKEETEEAIEAGTSTTDIATDLRIIISNGIINLPQTKVPINTDKELRLEIDGNTLVTEDYTLDSFTGVLTIVSTNVLNSVSATSNITINYTALKGFDTQWRYTIDNTPKYYIESDDPDYKADNLPIVYDSVTIKMRNLGTADNFELLTTINYAVSYFDNGDKFQINFITVNNQSDDRVTSDWTDLKNKEILVLYQYAPGSFADAGDVVQRVVGARGKLNLGKDFYLQAELAQSNKELNRGVAEAIDNIQGTGQSGDRYNLSNPNIVKDSERIIIVNENFEETLISNEEYSINYRSGYIRFRVGRVPKTTDVINAEYQYYVTSQGQQQQYTESGGALKLSTGGNMGAWNMAGYFSDVNEDFNPVGSIVQNKGTSEFGGSAAYQPNKHLKFTSDIRKNIAHKNDIDENAYDAVNLFQKYTLKFKPYNYGNMIVTHEQSNNNDDPHNIAATQNIHELDSSSYKQSLSYSFDLSRYPTLFEINRGNENNALGNTGKDNRWLHLKNTYTPFSQFKLISDYQESQEASHRPAAIPDEQLSNIKTTSITNLNLAYDPISQIKTQTNYAYNRSFAENAVTVNSTTKNLREVKDWTFDYTYTPGWSDVA